MPFRCAGRRILRRLLPLLHGHPVSPPQPPPRHLLFISIQIPETYRESIPIHWPVSIIGKVREITLCVPGTEITKPFDQIRSFLCVYSCRAHHLQGGGVVPTAHVPPSMASN